MKHGDDDHGDTDVLVVGAGPVGLGLARLLGIRGHQVTVVERKTAPYPLPRAVVFDDEIGRIFQNMGLSDEVRAVSTPVPDHYEWRNRDQEALLRIDWSGVGPSGWPVESFFSQPDLEKVLANSLDELDNVQVLRGVELVDITDHGDSVTAVCSGPEGSGGRDEPLTIEASFLAGCDGARSTVRDLLGIEMHDLGFRYDWLIVDTIPQDDIEWSPSNWQLCDPVRPTTVVSGGPGRRRWEFMRLPDEDPEELNSDQRAWELLEPWGRNSENSVLERRALYTFSARWADSWDEGRVVLAGDSAHQMPPFAGQGMCSGMRDVSNLAWKLDLALNQQAPPSILKTYTSERSLHIRHAIAMSVALGKVICVLDEDEAAERDLRMLAGEGDPDKVLPLTELPVLGEGIVSPKQDDDPLLGTHAPQFPVDAGALDAVTGHGPVLLTRSARDSDDPRAFSLLDLGDPTGAWEAWFDEIGAEAVMIRPDHYIYGTATAHDAPEVLRSYYAQISATSIRKTPTTATS